MSTHYHPLRQFVLRAVTTALGCALFYSASASGVNDLFARANSLLQQAGRAATGHYAQRPGPVFLGAKPGRDEIGRGGTWTPKLLADLARARLIERLEAPIAPNDLLTVIEPTLNAYVLQGGGGGGGGQGNGETGGSGGPGDPGDPGSGSQLNTNTGNRRASYPIIAWSARGDSGVEFALHHVSKGAYSFDLGKGWAHSYDIKIAHNVGSSAILRYPDGLEIPFTEAFDEFTPPAWIHDSLVHNPNGTWTLTTKLRKVLGFNSAGRLLSVTDRSGNAVSVNRDTYGKVSSVSDSSGRSILFAYTNGLVSSVTDPTGSVWSFTYDGANNLTAIAYPVLNGTVYSKSFTFNAASDMVSETDRRGKTWTYTYDPAERLTGFTNPLGSSWTWAYSNTAATLTNPDLTTKVYNYSAGLIASVVDEAGFSDSNTYDEDGNVATYTDRGANTWQFSYDGPGNLVTAQNPLGQTTSFTYNSTDDLLTVQTPAGDLSTTTRNAAGQSLTHTDPLGRTTETRTYDSFGNLLSGTDALGRATTYTYDSCGNLTSATNPDLTTSAATFDGVGRPLSQTDASGATTVISRDEWGRVVNIIKPGGATSQVDYDPNGNILQVTDPIGRTEQRSYDDLDLLVSVTNAKGESSQHAYTPLSRLASTTNPRGYTTNYTYTARGEVASATLPDGAVELWSHSATGKVSAYTNPLAQTTVYSYDAVGRVTTVDYPTGIDTTFAYDTSGRVQQMSDSTGITSWTYDAADQVGSLTSPGSALTYTYNLAGQRTAMNLAGEGTTSYGYNAFGRLTSVTDPIGHTTTYSYDSAGRVQAKANGNGVTESYTYTPESRPATISVKDSQDIVLTAKSCTYDVAGQVIQLVDGAVTSAYAYDLAGQLTSESKSTGYTATYTYDANGNRSSRVINGITETYAFDGADKLLCVAGGADPRTFTYDGAGRQTAVSRASGSTTYAYDYESRLTTVAAPWGTENYVYNGFDTRVGATGPSGTAEYVRDGVSPTSTLLSDGESDFMPGTSATKNGVTTYIHAGIKSNDLQTSPDGTVLAERQYDAFGNLVTSSGDWKPLFGYGGPFGYQEDQTTGLKLLGHRYYDSDTGRFLTRDPAKHGRNWYVYCDSNPVSNADPTGLTQYYYLYVLLSHEKALLKTGQSINPATRYTKRYLAEHGADLPTVIAIYTDKQACLADERALIKSADGCGPLNNEPWGYRRQMLKRQTLENMLLDTIKEVVTALDPTPVSTVIGAATIAGNEINEWAEPNNSGNWNHGGTGSYNQAYEDAMDPYD